MRTLSEHELASTSGAMGYSREEYSRDYSTDDQHPLVQSLDLFFRGIFGISCLVVAGKLDCGGDMYRPVSE